MEREIQVIKNALFRLIDQHFFIDTHFPMKCIDPDSDQYKVIQAENPRGFTSSRWKEVVQFTFFLSKWETIWTMSDALLSRLLHLIETPQLQELLVVKPN